MPATDRLHTSVHRGVVAGRPAVYTSVGTGPPLIFLHGWALGTRSYRHGLRRLAELGLTVLAPALPSFGGTAELPPEERSIEGYAAWVAAFLDEVGVSEPVTLVGHSFGGGVAIRTAYEQTERVNRLVAINSIGGSALSEAGGAMRSMAERPLWDWGLHLQADILPWRQFTRVLPVVAGDLLPNVMTNPRAIWRVGKIASRTNLTKELQALRERRLPVIILWGDKDTVVTRSSVESMRQALGDPESITVPGSHSWLIADPVAFGEVMTNVIGLAPGIPDDLTGKGGNSTSGKPAAGKPAAGKPAAREPAAGSSVQKLGP